MVCDVIVENASFALYTISTAEVLINNEIYQAGKSFTWQVNAILTFTNVRASSFQQAKQAVMRMLSSAQVRVEASFKASMTDANFEIVDTEATDFDEWSLTLSQSEQPSMVSNVEVGASACTVSIS